MFDYVKSLEVELSNVTRVAALLLSCTINSRMRVNSLLAFSSWSLNQTTFLIPHDGLESRCAIETIELAFIPGGGGKGVCPMDSIEDFKFHDSLSSLPHS